MAEDPQTQVLSVKKQEGHMVRAEGGLRDQKMRKKWQVAVMDGHLSLATTLGRKRPEAKSMVCLSFQCDLESLGRKE